MLFRNVAASQWLQFLCVELLLPWCSIPMRYCSYSREWVALCLFRSPNAALSFVSVKIFLFECIIKPNRNFTDRDTLYKHLCALLLVCAFRCSSSSSTLYDGFFFSACCWLTYSCILTSFREFDEIIGKTKRNPPEKAIPFGISDIARCLHVKGAHQTNEAKKEEKTK